MSIASSSSGDDWKTSRSSWTCTSSPQSVGGPRAGEIGGGSSGSPLCMKQHVGENLPDRPRLGDESDEPDVTAARRALERKLLPHPRHEFRPGDPGGVVRVGLCMSVKTAFRGLPAGHRPAPLANVPDGQRRDGRPQRVVRREYSVIAMPVLPRRRHEIGEPIEKLKRQQIDDAVVARPVDVSR